MASAPGTGWLLVARIPTSEALAVVRRDEVGHLTESFNRLLVKLQTSQSEMVHMAPHDVLTSLPDQAEKIACAVAAKCLATIETPLPLRGEQHAIGAFIGIAMGDGQTTPHDLQIAADSAMCRAKQAGGQRYCMPARPAMANA